MPSKAKDERRKERAERKAERRAHKENVTLFGSNLTETDYRHFDSGNLVWGVILILAGGLFLLNSFGIVPWIVWNSIWRFWPILLILWGLQVILGGGRIARALMAILTIAALVVIALYAISVYNHQFSSQMPPQMQNMFRMMGGQTQ